jgi:hypothetical protein
MEHSSPQSTFEHRKSALDMGIRHLDGLIERLELALPESQDVAGIKSLHPEIYARCRTLYAGGDYAEALEKGFKVVRDRLRSLTGYETGSEAFGKGKLYIPLTWPVQCLRSAFYLWMTTPSCVPSCANYSNCSPTFKF